MSTEKTSWPEVVGMPTTPAVMKINSDRPDVTIVVLPVGTCATPPGFNPKRVCVFFDALDKLGRVAATPVVG